jgi:hypothetical protein
MAAAAPRVAPAAPVQAAAPSSLRKVLLGCGVLSSALYVTADVLAWQRYEGYRPLSQNVSELLASGAPTRPLLLALLVVTYNLLVIALAAGLWASPGRKGALRITAALLVIYAVLGALTGGFFQMDIRGTEATPRGALHPPMTLVMSVFILLFMAVGASLHGERFRLYSLGTLLTVVVFGVLTGLDAPQLVANQPTPWMGLKERVNIYATMLWIALLALSLWRAQGERPRDDCGGRSHAGYAEPAPQQAALRESDSERAEWVSSAGRPSSR